MNVTRVISAKVNSGSPSLCPLAPYTLNVRLGYLSRGSSRSPDIWEEWRTLFRVCTIRNFPKGKYFVATFAEVVYLQRYNSPTFFFKTRLRYNYIDRLSLILYFLFSGVLQKWRHERQILAQKFLNQGPAYLSSSAPSLRGHSSLVCEHIVVMNKRDLVPEWGIEVSNITTFGDLILTYSSYPYVPLITFFYNINLQPSAVPTGH